MSARPLPPGHTRAAPSVAPDSDQLRKVLLAHHPIMRSETGPFSGCRCGGVRLGQDVIQHVIDALLSGPLRQHLRERDEAVAEAEKRLDALIEVRAKRDQLLREHTERGEALQRVRELDPVEVALGGLQYVVQQMDGAP